MRDFVVVMKTTEDVLSAQSTPVAGILLQLHHAVQGSLDEQLAIERCVTGAVTWARQMSVAQQVRGLLKQWLALPVEQIEQFRRTSTGHSVLAADFSPIILTHLVLEHLGSEVFARTLGGSELSLTGSCCYTYDRGVPYVTLTVFNPSFTHSVSSLVRQPMIEDLYDFHKAYNGIEQEYAFLAAKLTLAINRNLHLEPLNLNQYEQHRISPEGARSTS